MANRLRWKIAQFFEIHWWRSYLRRKSPAEYAAWKRAYWKKQIDGMGDDVVLREGDRILDAGCGPAGIFMVLEAYRPDALDPLLDVYEAFLPHFNRAHYPAVRFVHSTLEEFRSERHYDTVFCLNAIDHVDDLAAAYDRLAALTRPGGTLVISVDAHRYVWIKRLFRLIPGDALHPHQFSESEYTAMLTSRGYSVIKTMVTKRELFFSHILQIARRD